MQYTVYGLKDPNDKLFHYVGVTKDLNQRLAAHFYYYSSIKKADSPVQQWLNSIGVECEVVVLVKVQTNNKNFEERKWIAKLKVEGHPLLNLKNTLPHIRRPIFTSKSVPMKAFWKDMTPERRQAFVAKRYEAIKKGWEIRKQRAKEELLKSAGKVEEVESGATK